MYVLDHLAVSVHFAPDTYSVSCILSQGRLLFLELAEKESSWDLLVS